MGCQHVWVSEAHYAMMPDLKWVLLCCVRTYGCTLWLLQSILALHVEISFSRYIRTYHTVSLWEGGKQASGNGETFRKKKEVAIYATAASRVSIGLSWSNLANLSCTKIDKSRYYLISGLINLCLFKARGFFSQELANLSHFDRLDSTKGFSLVEECLE